MSQTQKISRPDTGAATPFSVACETPARHRDAVVIVGDTFFVQAGLLLARQLREREPDSFDIVVLCSEEIEVPAALREGLRMGRVTVGDRSLMPVDERIRIEAYVRIFLPYLLPEYRRICYIDADMYLNRPGLAALLEKDMQGHALAAVRDVVLWIEELRGKPYSVHPDEPLQARERYFNSGFLMIDSAAYRAALPVPEMLRYLRAYADRMPTHDQSFLNAQFSHRYLMLSPVYNFPMLDAYTPLVQSEAPVLLHFLGAEKPWYPTEDPLRLCYWQEYSAFLSDNFGFEGRENVHEIIRKREGRQRNYGSLRQRLSRMNHARKLKRSRAFARDAWALQMERVELR